MNKNKQKTRKRKFYSTVAAKTHDLFVPLPATPPVALKLRSIAERLLSVDCHSMAVTYTVFGSPQPHVAPEVLPYSVFPFSADFDSLSCLRRLHVVVESVSEAISFSSASPWLQAYQLVSMAPRNAATFRQACGANHIDIVMLDYASVRGGLPYSIASTDLRVLFARGAVLEIPYAAAVLQPSLRPHFIQACRELELACIGVSSRPHLLLSSGPTPTDSTKPTESSDGVLSLHSYTDVLHMITTLTGLKESWFQGSSDMAIRHGERRVGGGVLRPVSDSPAAVPSSSASKMVAKETAPTTKTKEIVTDIKVKVEETQGEDGFISF